MTTEARNSRLSIIETLRLLHENLNRVEKSLRLSTDRVEAVKAAEIMRAELISIEREVNNFQAPAPLVVTQKKLDLVPDEDKVGVTVDLAVVARLIGRTQPLNQGTHFELLAALEDYTECGDETRLNLVRNINWGVDEVKS